MDRWFADMAAHMAEFLDTAGIAYCTGGAMAKNDDWRHTVSEWKRLIDDWIRRSNPSDLLNVGIFYDLRPVHGDATLAEDIRSYAFALFLLIKSMNSLKKKEAEAPAAPPAPPRGEVLLEEIRDLLKK